MRSLRFRPCLPTTAQVTLSRLIQLILLEEAVRGLISDATENTVRHTPAHGSSHPDCFLASELKSDEHSAGRGQAASSNWREGGGVSRRGGSVPSKHPKPTFCARRGPLRLQGTAWAENFWAISGPFPLVFENYASSSDRSLPPKQAHTLCWAHNDTFSRAFEPKLQF